MSEDVEVLVKIGNRFYEGKLHPQKVGEPARLPDKKSPVFPEPYAEMLSQPTPPPSPLHHFIRENCQNCPFQNTCDQHIQLRCLLARLCLDLHTLVANDIRRDRHLNW